MFYIFYATMLYKKIDVKIDVFFFTTGNGRSRTVRVRLWPTDGLLVSARLSANAGTVSTTCTILWSILWTTGTIYEQHEDACTKCRCLAADASYRHTSDSECALAAGPAAHYGNIHHATPVPYTMKLIIDQLIVTYDIVASGLLRKSFCHIPRATFIFKFSGMCVYGCVIVCKTVYVCSAHMVLSVL